MAHIRRHPKSPDRWQVRYIDPTGRERSKNFSKKSEAEKFLYTVEADKLRGRWVDPAAGKVTFGEFAGQWLDAQVFDAKTREAMGAQAVALALGWLVFEPFLEAAAGLDPEARAERRRALRAAVEHLAGG